MNYRQYTESDIRSKLSQYADAHIASISATETSIQIRFKEGYGSTYGESFSQELYVTTITELKEACKKSNLISLESWQAQQAVDEITNSFVEAKEIEEAIEVQADEIETDFKTKKLPKIHQYSEEELRSKLGEVTSSKIESIISNDSGIHICLKDGFRAFYKGRYEKEIHVRLIGEMRKALDQIEQKDESYFSYMEEKIGELSQEAQEKVDRYQYGWKSFSPPYRFEENTLALWFKPGLSNDYPQSMNIIPSPRPYLAFSFNQLDEKEHIKATQREYFLGTPEHAARLEKEAKEKEEKEKKTLKNHFARGGELLDSYGPRFFDDIQSLAHRHWPSQTTRKDEISFELKEQDDYGRPNYVMPKEFSITFAEMNRCKEAIEILEKNYDRKDLEDRTQQFEHLWTLIGQKLDEISPQAKEKIEHYEIYWDCDEPDNPAVEIQLKKGILNDFHHGLPFSSLNFKLEELLLGFHLKATKEEHFQELPCQQPQELTLDPVTMQESRTLTAVYEDPKEIVVTDSTITTTQTLERTFRTIEKEPYETRL